MLKKEGNSLVYTTIDGEIIKKFRKAWERNDDGCLDKVMADITANPHVAPSTPLGAAPEELLDESAELAE